MSAIPVATQYTPTQPPVAQSYWKQAMPATGKTFASLSPEQKAIEKKKAGCWASFCCFLIIIIVVAVVAAFALWAADQICNDPEKCPYQKMADYKPFTGEAVISEATTAKTIDVQITRGVFTATAGTKNVANVTSSVALEEQYQDKNVFNLVGDTWSSTYESNSDSTGVHNCYYCRYADVGLTFDANSLDTVRIKSEFVPIIILSGDAMSKVMVTKDIDLSVTFKGGIFVAPELDIGGKLIAKTNAGDITFNDTIVADSIAISSGLGNLMFGGDIISTDNDIQIKSGSEVTIEAMSLTSSSSGQIVIESGGRLTIKADNITANSSSADKSYVDLQSGLSGITLEGKNAITADNIKIYSGAGVTVISPMIVATGKVELLTTAFGPMIVESSINAKEIEIVNSKEGGITFDVMITGTDKVTMKGIGFTKITKGIETALLAIEVGTSGEVDLTGLDGTKIDGITISSGFVGSVVNIDFTCDPTRKIVFKADYSNITGKDGSIPVYKKGGAVQSLTWVEKVESAISGIGYKLFETTYEGCVGASGSEVIEVTVKLASSAFKTFGSFEFRELMPLP